MKNKKQQIHVEISRYATKNNKQSYVGAGPVSAQNAITLVALVITVIILLILAGVTINLTLGNNGIFKTAQQAAKNYTDAQNKELGDLNEFENIVDKVTKAPEYNPSLLQLKPGDYVKYDTGADGVGVATFRVLYDATSEYGLQIISDKNLENVTLGGSDWATASKSYNDAIETLNNKTNKYKNSAYALDARCVGSNPGNKNLEATTNVILQFTPTGWITTASGCKGLDTNYETDLTVMKKLNINNSGDYYWLASRNIDSTLNYAVFAVSRVDLDGNLAGNSLCDISANGVTNAYLRPNGFRPCITLKPDITITSGDGASEATAYTLGV